MTPLPNELAKRISYGYGVLITDTPSDADIQNHWTTNLGLKPILIKKNDQELHLARNSLFDLQAQTAARNSFLCFSEYQAREIYRFSTTSRLSSDVVDLCSLMDLHRLVAESDNYCFRFESVLPSGESLPLTPIEIYLRRALDKAGMSYQMQVPVGKFVVDFLVEHDGKSVIVEADGKQYHIPEKDKIRDSKIKNEFELDTIRFGGSRIVRDADSCVSEIKEYFLGVSRVTPDFPMEDAEKLDKSQLQAIKHLSGPARVLAPAGSGKTKVLINRVIELLNRGINPRGILCLTFDKHAQKQIAERLSEIGVKNQRPTQRQENLVTVATFNSLGDSIVNRMGVTGSTQRHFEIVDSRSVNRAKYFHILEESANRSNSRPQFKRGNADPWGPLIDGIGEVKRGLRDITGVDAVKVPYQGDDDDAREQEIGSFIKAFEEGCIQHGVMTFDDQIYLAGQTLLQDHSLRHQYQNKFSHILVDEYQDLNPAQICLLRLISARNQEIFSVGDDDQLIYSWRHVASDNIVNFDKTFNGMTEFQLETNYRSAKEVVDRSQNVIQWNVSRIPKKIKPGPTNPRGRVDVFAGANIDEQLSEMVKVIKRSVSDTNRQYKDCAVLSRVKAHHLRIARALDKESIPRQKIVDIVLYSSPVAKHLSAYLKICSDPYRATADDYANIINRPNRYIKNEFVTNRLLRAENPFDFLKIQTQEPAKKVNRPGERNIPARNKSQESWKNQHLIDFLNSVERISKDFHKMKPADAIDLVIQNFAFVPAENVKKESADDVDAAATVEILREDAKGHENLDNFINHMNVMEDAEEKGTEGAGIDPYDDELTDFVTISTIHGAKGREWSSVVLFDCSEDEEKGSGVTEEERRVFYVGMTRAKRELSLLTRAETPSSLIKDAYVPSKFRNVPNPAKEVEREIIKLKKDLAKIDVVGPEKEINRLRDRKTKLQDGLKQNLEQQTQVREGISSDSRPRRLFKIRSERSPLHILDDLHKDERRIENQIDDIDQELVRLDHDLSLLAGRIRKKDKMKESIKSLEKSIPVLDLYDTSTQSDQNDNS